SINIDNLAVGKETMGNITLDVDQPLLGQTTLDLSANGPGLDMSVVGDYNAAQGETPQIELRADIRMLSLAAIQPFVRGQVTGLKGNVKSSLTILGTADQPDIDGTLTFENVEAIPGYTGSTLKLQEETIAFRGSTVELNNFTIRDQVDNSLVLDGLVTADDQYTLDLTATAKDFQLLNTREGDNDLFYGQVWLNTTAQVGGTLEHPEVEMSLGLGEKSNFTFVVPQSEAGVMASEGIVTFIDRDQPVDSLANINKVDSLSASVPFQGITLTAQVELSGEETFSIVLDPLTEDKLVVSGEASLTLDIDDTGNMDLTGRYELTKGSYDFTFYNLVKRNFVIEEGSTITWSGEPMNAALDITATYRIDASPIDLVASQTGEDADLEPYRSRLPFLVYLNIKGDLLRPEISFSLDMPEQQRGAVGGSVYARIQDINTRESDVNKQVFALLILQRFVSDNPFETQSGGTLEAAARTSVNRMLSDQLNRMAQNIKGVEITFDLESYTDYEEGNASDRTQLQLGVSKRLLDDRLVVKLSGNVDIEGGQSQHNNFSDYIGDLALEYKLTEDGRFRINGFYNSDYDMIDGELKEAGVGLIYIKDYDSLRELFKSNDRKTK
ncbi:MAG TPA: translocation/assembly module TamB domain-containing protein, partial [Cyclobacteriaceae bacterium]|nr:translocation/assembly module TamB domain-containing protein [Cyclobacteriaceae bacterium]